MNHDKRLGLKDIDDQGHDGRIRALDLQHQHGDNSAVESSARPIPSLHQGPHTQSAVVYIEVSGEAKNNTAQNELSDWWLEDK